MTCSFRPAIATKGYQDPLPRKVNAMAVSLRPTYSCYWRFNNYVALYELQELKDCEKPQNKHHKKRYKNVTHCFILNGKELLIHYSTIADIFRDVYL